MSARSIKRHAARRRDRRAAGARKLAGAVIGASALLTPAAAEAATFEVNSLNDGAADPCDATCTLRDAVAAANATPDADTITFASGLTGTIRLTQGQLATNTNSAGGLTVTGPGPGTLAISGDADNDGSPSAADSQIFRINGNGGAVSISGLTLRDAYVPNNYPGGAIYSYSPLTLDDVTLTSNATRQEGGAIAARSDLTITDSTLTDNVAGSGGSTGNGGAISFRSQNNPRTLTITDTRITGNSGGNGGGVYIGRSDATSTITGSTISDNQAVHQPGSSPTGAAGGIFAGGDVTISGSTINGNDALTDGGGIGGRPAFSQDLKITNSTISGNSAGGQAGGIDFTRPAIPPAGKYSGYNPAVTGELVRTNVSGNQAGAGAGGLAIEITDNDSFAISASTFAGNVAARRGGGILLSDSDGSFSLADSTLSGNTAARGGGASLQPTDAIGVANSTIADNHASTVGGGLYLDSFDDPGTGYREISDVTLLSTIVGDNAGASGPDDLASAPTPNPSGSFKPDHSLVEAPGSAAVSGGTANLTGLDPGLLPLADNGGPTRTQSLKDASPAIDAGAAGGLTQDQRGQPRTVDLYPPNVADGTDIGAVELATATPPPPPPPPDTTAPKVSIDKAPKRKLKTRKRSVKVKLAFSADEAGSRFECRVDGGSFEPCSSPLKVRLKSKPGKGRAHTIEVRATDAAGNVGQAAEATVRVIRKRR